MKADSFLLCSFLLLNLDKCSLDQQCIFFPDTPKYVADMLPDFPSRRQILHVILYQMQFFLQLILLLSPWLGMHFLSVELFPLKGSVFTRVCSKVLPAISIILIGQDSRPPALSCSSFTCINFFNSEPGVGGTNMQDFRTCELSTHHLAWKIRKHYSINPVVICYLIHWLIGSVLPYTNMF